jgi:predicted carbohydrate-binding protein with CBM5 and CBM33 domain
VLRPAAAHPLLGRPVCRVGDCEATAVRACAGTTGNCPRCPAVVCDRAGGC